MRSDTRLPGHRSLVTMESSRVFRIEFLPFDAIYDLFKFLSPGQLVKFERLSKKLREVCEKREKAVRGLYFVHDGHGHTSLVPAYSRKCHCAPSPIPIWPIPILETLGTSSEEMIWDMEEETSNSVTSDYDDPPLLPVFREKFLDILAKFPCIMALHFSEKIYDAGLQAARSIGQLYSQNHSRLVHLSFFGNSLTNFVLEILKHVRVKHLSISQLDLNNKLQILKNCPDLVELDDYYADEKVTEEFEEIISKLKYLHVLNYVIDHPLKMNYLEELTYGGSAKNFKTLFENSPNIEKLTIAYLTDLDSPSSSDKLATQVLSRSKLRHLIIEYNDIHSDYLHSFLRLNKTLNSVEIKGVEVRDTSQSFTRMEKVCQLLKTHCTVGKIKMTIVLENHKSFLECTRVLSLLSLEKPSTLVVIHFMANKSLENDFVSRLYFKQNNLRWSITFSAPTFF